MIPAADVTVIIPTYNGRTRGFIGRAIDSVMAQSLGVRRFFVVDDGSTDDTVAWLGSAYPELEVKRKVNGGLPSARNFGLSFVETAYVCFLDDDDEWLPTKIAAQMAHLQAHPEQGFVFCGIEFIDKDGRHLGQRLPVEVGWQFPEILLGNTILPPSTVMFAKALIDKAGPFDETLRQGEDYEYFIRCARHGRIGAVPQVLVRYRQHAGQMSGDLRYIDDVTLTIIERHAAESVPKQRAAIVRYFCYGAIVRALLRRDIAYSRQVWGRMREPVHLFDFVCRGIGVLLAPLVPLKQRWRQWEYRRVLGA